MRKKDDNSEEGGTVIETGLNFRTGKTRSIWTNSTPSRIARDLAKNGESRKTSTAQEQPKPPSFSNLDFRLITPENAAKQDYIGESIGEDGQVAVEQEIDNVPIATPKSQNWQHTEEMQKFTKKPKSLLSVLPNDTFWLREENIGRKIDEGACSKSLEADPELDECVSSLLMPGNR